VGCPMRARDLVYDDTLDQIRDHESCPVGIVCVGTAAEVHDKALEVMGSATWVVLDAPDLVPQQALIVASCRHGTRVAVAVQSEQHLLDLEPVLANVAALLVPTGDGTNEEQLWRKATLARAGSGKEGQALLNTLCGGLLLPATEDLKGARVETIGVMDGAADRVCIDCIQMLREGEGILVGSTPQALCFVHANTAPSSSGPARPFRISAGPVHACVALPDGRTKYLSELQAGEQVMIVEIQDGRVSPTSRGVVVGRCHVERAPVMCIHMNFRGVSNSFFFEKSASVRLNVRHDRNQEIAAAFAPLPVTEVCQGDEVLVHWISSSD